jgi:lipase
VVLVHGSLDRATSFARVVRRLTDLHVVTYDRRGYHRSRDRPVSGTDVFNQHVRDLLDVIGGRDAVAVGHSFGGDIAIAAAIANPGVVRAVGAYEPPMPWLDWWPSRHGREGRSEDPGLRAEAFFRRMVGDDAWERLPERSRQERRADGPALVAELAALRNGAAPFDIAELSVPAVLGRGERSVAHHRRAIEVLEELTPDATIFEIPGASHGAHLSHPDTFATFVRVVVSRAESTEAKEHAS